MTLPIEIDSKAHVKPGDLGLVVTDTSVCVPLELGAILKKLRVQSLERFATMLVSFPTPFMIELGWDRPTFEMARERALDKLGALVDARFIRLNRPRHERGMGALPPPTAASTPIGGRMKIAFCGAGGTGKTTTQQLVCGATGLPPLKSASREVYEEQSLTEEIVGRMSLDEAWKLQFSIFSKKIEKDKQESYVADRTLLDHYAYCLLYCAKRITDSDHAHVENLVRNHMRTAYHRVFYFPYGVFPVPDDGIRNANHAWQSTIDAIIGGFIKRWELKPYVVRVPGIEERAKWVTERLERPRWW